MITLLTPLCLYAHLTPHKTALVADGQRFDYRTLYSLARRLAMLLYTRYEVRPGSTVALLCRNHLLSTLLIPALSRLGVHIRFLNSDIPALQMSTLLDGRYRYLIYDAELRAHCLPPTLPCPSLTSEALLQLLLQTDDSGVSLPRVTQRASISVFSGGTSGSYKLASRRMGIWPFVSPFLALVRKVRIHRYASVLIALPYYHGFGLATLIVSLVLGKKVCLLRHFQSDEVLRVVREEKIEVLPVVPAMLSRLWQQSEAMSALSSVRCIISGGDRLESSLAKHTQQLLGPIVFNLYGTSEAGFLLLAQPSDLAQAPVESSVLGRPLWGVRCEVREPDAEGLGTLWVRSGWAMIGQQDRWQCTGDSVSLSSDGCYFHHGRADRTVVCAGENVSLDRVEQTLNSHPAVFASQAFVVPDAQFGQVVHVQVELQPSVDPVSEVQLLQWSAEHLSRAERPHKICFGKIEHLSTGKRGDLYHKHI